MESVDFPYRKQILRLRLLIFLQLNPQQYTIWKPVIQTECSLCVSPATYTSYSVNNVVHLDNTLLHLTRF